jgi:hypothetical protein
MAENTTKCEMMNCIHHIETQTSSGTPKVIYKFRVHFRNMEEVYKHAAIDMQRDVALRARAGKPIPVRDDGSHVDIYADCEFTRTVDDELKDIAKMNDEQKDAYGKMLLMKLEALKKAQSVASANDTAAKKK